MLGLFTLGLFLGAQLVFCRRLHFNLVHVFSFCSEVISVQLPECRCRCRRRRRRCRRRRRLVVVVGVLPHFQKQAVTKTGNQKNNVWRIAAQNHFQHYW